jgi:phosphatidylglycerophosphatase GEP4
LREAYPGRKLLIVSNTAGAYAMDPEGKLASEVEKPGCGPEIMEYFRKYPETGVTRPDQVAVVGDRITTDVMVANLMGSYAVWVKDGVVPPEKSSIVSLTYGPIHGALF